MAGGREGFVDGDVDAGQLGAGEAGEVLEVEGGVDDGDVHRHLELRQDFSVAAFVARRAAEWVKWAGRWVRGSDGILAAVGGEDMGRCSGSD